MKSIIFSTGLRYAALLLLVTDLSGGSPPARAQEQASATESGDELATIIVTARKREESLAEVPTSITAFTAESLKDYNIQSFSDYATKTPDLSFTYGGGPTGIADARTIAIRGITGQNLFGTAGATGFYIDDTPVPGSLDPRVVDLANIEVLKGPQGTLYGESSLGGNVRADHQAAGPQQLRLRLHGRCRRYLRRRQRRTPAATSSATWCSCPERWRCGWCCSPIMMPAI